MEFTGKSENIVTVVLARKYLGKLSEKLTDEEVNVLINELSTLADITLTISKEVAI